MAAPNLRNVSSIIGKSKGQALTTSLVDFLENVAASGKLLKINEFIIANIDGSAAVDITVTFYDASATATYNIAKLVTLPAKASIDVFARPFYLEEGDKIQIQAAVNSDAEATISWEELDD